MTDVEVTPKKRELVEKRAREREWAKERYRTDPEFRRKKIEGIVRRRKERWKTDPEFRRKESEFVCKRIREKCEDLQFYMKYRDRVNSRYRKKYKTDSTFCRKRQRSARESYRNNRTAEIYKRQMSKDEIKDLKRRFLETLEKSAFIGITAKHLDITEKRVYGWMQRDPEFANAVRAAQARTAERVGLALITKALVDNDTSAQIFVCKTLGRPLGFDEKQPVVNINVGTQPDFDTSGLSLEEKEQLLQLLRKSKQQKLNDDAVDV
jgi:hypothetical protein